MRKLAAALVALCLSSCAMILNTHPERLSFIGPDSLKVIDQEGKVLQTRSDDARFKFVNLEWGLDDLVHFDYAGSRRTVLLERRPNLWIIPDLFFSFGFLAVPEDASHTWANYPKLTLLPESFRGRDTAIVDYRSFPAFIYKDRIKLLVGAGVGLGGILTQAVIGPNSYEYFIGLSYRKKIDLFYQASGAVYADVRSLRNDSLSFDPVFSTRGVCMRLSPIWGFFTELGYGRLRFGTDSASRGRGYDLGPSYVSTNAMSVGVGWAGDFGFIRLSKTFGTSDVSIFNLPPSPIRFYKFSWGLNFRL